MNTILTFVIEVFLTLLLSALLVGYLRPFLRKALVDLCGTEDRAQFWTAFSQILLIGLPVIFALQYRPRAASPEEVFFELASQVSGNLGGLLFALTGIGVIVSFFTLAASKQKKLETK